VPAEAVERLDAVGRWVAVNGDAMYGPTERVQDRMEWMATGQWTIKGNTAYYWCNRWPGGELVIGGLSPQVRSVSYLANGQPIAFEQQPDRLVLRNLPDRNPDAIVGVTVIKIDFAGPPRQTLGAGYVTL